MFGDENQAAIQISFEQDNSLSEEEIINITIFSILGVVLLAIIVVLLVLLFIRIKDKFKKDPFDAIELSIQRPDFDALCFANEPDHVIYESIPEDDFVFLEETLFATNKVVFEAFISTLNSSDLDNASKQLIFVSEYSNLSIDFINFTMRREIENCCIF